MRGKWPLKYWCATTNYRPGEEIQVPFDVMYAQHHHPGVKRHSTIHLGQSFVTSRLPFNPTPSHHCISSDLGIKPLTTIMPPKYDDPPPPYEPSSPSSSQPQPRPQPRPQPSHNAAISPQDTDNLTVPLRSRNGIPPEERRSMGKQLQDKTLVSLGRSIRHIRGLFHNLPQSPLKTGYGHVIF